MEPSANLLITSYGHRNKTLFGRDGVVADLRTLLLEEPAPLVITGLGGVGKSEVARAISQGLPGRQFAVSLRDAPPMHVAVETLLNEMSERPIDGQLGLEVLELACKREQFTLIFDNVDAVLDNDGVFRPQHSEYAELVAVLSTIHSTSRFLLTSRITPQKDYFRGDNKHHVHRLLGIAESGVDLMVAQGCDTDDKMALREIVHRLSGNPLCLIQASQIMQELYGGNAQSYIQAGELSTGSTDEWLRKEMVRLSIDDFLVMVRLATAREPLNVVQISAGILYPTARAAYTPILLSLVRRQLVETTNHGRFYLQYLIQEACLTVFIEKLVAEWISGELPLFGSSPIVDTQMPFFVRDSQAQAIRELLIRTMPPRYRSIRSVRERGQQLLPACAIGGEHYATFATANILTIIQLFGGSLENLDFRGTFVRNFDFSASNLMNANARDAEFHSCRFASLFANIFALALSSDGRRLLIAYQGGALGVVELPSGRLLQLHSWDAEWLRSIALSGDNMTAAMTDDRGRIKILSLVTGASNEYPGNGRQIRALVFNSDDEIVYGGGEDMLLRKVDVAAGSGVVVLSNTYSEIWGLAVSDDLLLVVGASFGLRALRAETGDEVFTRGLGAISGRSIAYCPGNRVAFVGRDDGRITAWRLPGGEEVFNDQTHSGPVWAIDAVVEDGRTFLYSGSSDGSIVSLELSQSLKVEGRRVVANSDGPVWPLLVDEKRQYVASVTANAAVRVWEARGLRRLESLEGASSAVLSILPSPASDRIAIGLQDGTLALWDAAGRKALYTRRAHSGGIRSLSFDRRGKMLASGGEDGIVRLWDVESGELTGVLEGPHNWVWSLDFSEDGRRLVAGSADTFVHLWDLSKPGVSKKGLGHEARVIGVAFDDVRIESLDVAGKVRSWEIEEELVGRPEVDIGSVLSAVCRSESKWVAASFDGEVYEVADSRSSATQGQVGKFRLRSLVSCGQGRYIGLTEDSLIRYWREGLRSEPTVMSLGAEGRTLCWLESERAAIVVTENGEVLRLSETVSHYSSAMVPRRYEAFDVRGSVGVSDGERRGLASLGAITD